MILCGVDIETTGIEFSEGHKIIEIAIILAKLEDEKFNYLGKYVQRVNPERPIQAAAQEVHGISYGDLVAEPKWKAVAPKVAKILSKSDVYVAHNAAFDLPFIDHELHLVDEAVPAKNYICTMEQSRWATVNGKSPSLKELCFALDVEYDTSKAHAALYDVKVMMDCLERALKYGFIRLDDHDSVY